MIATTPDHTGNGQLTPPTPGDIAKALTGRDYISHSQISTFQACSLKWHFSYVEQAKPERVSAALLLGSSIHAAIQRHLECQLAGEKPPTIDELMAVVQETWKEEAGETPIEYSREDDEQSQADTARRMIESYLASPHSKVEGQTLAIEEMLRVSLAPDLPDLVAKLDHVAAVDGQLIVTDYKTTRSMWSRDTAEEHAEQLHLYAEAVKSIAEDFNLPVKLRFVIITKAKTPKVEALEIKADPERVKRSQLIIRNVFQAMQTGVVFPSPSTMNCSGCPFKNRCDRWHHESFDP
jgi:putative RecB family exonuclease